MIDKNSIVYQIVTDRFDNQDGNLEITRSQPEYQSRLKGRMGGTFKGIERRISYLNELGITHLMISPVERCKEGGYHGYHVTHPCEIDPALGTPEDLQNLSKKLSDSGISLILDYVPLIISDKSKLFQEKIKTRKGREWFFFRENLDHDIYGEELQRLTARPYCDEAEYFYFFEKGLPYFNLGNPEVIDWHINRLTDLIGKYGFRDVRLDVGWYIPEKSLKRISEETKSRLKRDISFVIENWPHPLDSPGVDAYGLCDGEFDMKGMRIFNHMPSDPDFLNSLRNHFYRTKGKSDCGYVFIAGIDNHDLPRFKGNEEVQKLTATLQFTMPNFTPMIYYGNESRMNDEGSDSGAVSRGVMQFSETNKLLEFYKRLIRLRKKNDFTQAKLKRFNFTEDGLVNYTLIFPSKKYHVVANIEGKPKNINLELLFAEQGVIPTDLISGNHLQKADEERHIIGAKDAYVFANNSNQ